MSKIKQHLFLLFALFLYGINAAAHPMPNSVLCINMQETGFDADLHLPLKELQLAVGFDVTNHTETLVQRSSAQIIAYILAHTRIKTTDGIAWTIAVERLTVGQAEQTATGLYQELTAKLHVQAPAKADIRTFTIAYDGIVHQVANHKILVSVGQDWERGQVEAQNTEVGVIGLDIVTNVVLPLRINLAKGSNWAGFKSMVNLGMQHITEGTDHLLFLLMLLLPATLLVENGRWAGFVGVRTSLVRLLKLVTAFTLGHSLTLLLGALQWVRLPSQPVEICIAITILVTAIHALRPIFSRKEIYIASGFGLIHGLAFATVLTDLHLSAYKMGLSILGFNIGIELMQLFVILLVIPWLILLSGTAAHKFVRICGAVFAAIAALAWAVERCIAQPNFITILVEQAATYAKWGVLALAIVSIFTHFYTRKNMPLDGVER